MKAATALASLAMTAFSAGLGNPAIAQEEKLAAPVEQCIRENAPRVEKTVPSLTDATGFLVENVCAPEASREIERQVEVKLKKISDHQKCLTAAGTDTKAREACGSESENAFAGIFAQLPLAAIPISKRLPEATAFAAKELLRLRLAGTKSGN